jgi:DHA2 family multidrug resistance protein-like MFS transporter
MLDLSLFRSAPLVAGLLMAFVSSGALTGFEFVLAQELQFVVGLSPLDAGLFMLPLIVAAAVAGPVSGWLVRLIGLRMLASVGLVVASASFAALAGIDLGEQAGLATAALAVLGFSLGATLLAGSVAIMGGAPQERAGAAGAMESTGFELGGALGITFFGVIVGAVYRSSLDFPNPAAGGSSIGEAAAAARSLSQAEADVLMEAAGSAFTTAHETVLQGAAALMLVLALTVFVILKGRNIDNSSHG